MRATTTEKEDRAVILADAGAVPMDSQVGTQASKRDASKASFPQLTSDLSSCLSECASVTNRERDVVAKAAEFAEAVTR